MKTISRILSILLVFTISLQLTLTNEFLGIKINNTVYAEDLPDSEAPTAPAELSVSSKTASSISLIWTASTDNVGVTGYKVYRDGNEIATSTVNTFNDIGLTEATTYSYTVKAYDAANNLSPDSNVLSVITSDITVPSAPANFASSDITYTSAYLSWEQSTDNVGVAGYERQHNRAYLGFHSKYI